MILYQNICWTVLLCKCYQVLERSSSYMGAVNFSNKTVCSENVVMGNMVYIGRVNDYNNIYIC